MTSHVQYDGVNIGGWLVTESWITPSLYSAHNVSEGSGEWQLSQQLGPQAQSVMEEHWDSWLAEADVELLSSVHTTHVRIPVGYWIVDQRPGEPFAAGGWKYLERSLRWFRNYNISVVLDLHGAPGSQNGKDHSGKSGPIEWIKPENIARTISVLKEIASRSIELNGHPETLNVITGIELLNEPWTEAVGGPISLRDTLLPFYTNASQEIRQLGFTGDLWFHDGFDYDNRLWDGFMVDSGPFSNYIDSHIYHCFGGERQQSEAWSNVMYACKHDGDMIRSKTNRLPTVVGEWSLATGRAPDTQTLAGKSWLASFYAAQREAYGVWSSGAGSFFWNFKIETGADDWNFVEGVQMKWISGVSSSYDFQCSEIV